ncbi:MAG: carboxypeptidase-like regulatory domain-containing protein [Bacteroidales bacterium]|nr:carboxypeptidase-like regulatory domain-containing protein [Bacteroidales bacterium]
MKTDKFVFLLTILLTATVSFAQKVTVDAVNMPANEILTKLHNTYHIPLSFDDRKLSRYKVTLQSDFQSPAVAIGKLLEGLPFSLEIQDDVFVIYPIRKTKKTKLFTLSGKVLEKGSGEPLPYSHVIINGKGMVSDRNGSFAFSSSVDSIFKLRVSHLGYYILDTVFLPKQSLQIMLSPSSIGLSEIVIKDQRIETGTQIGIQAGVEKLNHKIANFLPGYGDNSIFNLLRLQPGILASGEQTNELIIWGSYEGHSKVTFDGFTVYGLRNFNDNISTFNPLMAKNIEVMKGGYDARWGERVGGVVNISGKNGNMEKPSFTLVANNMTLNGLVEFPLFKNGALVIAFRHTYYNLYNPEDMNFWIRENDDTDSATRVDYTLVPDYRFRDFNVKYSAKIKDSDLFYISLYGGSDKFSYSIDEPIQNVILDKKTREENTQLGTSVFYGKTWNKGNTSNLNVSYSGLGSSFSDDLTVRFPNPKYNNNLKNLESNNLIREYTVELDNRLSLNQTHTLEGGIGFKFNEVILKEDTFNISQVDIRSRAQRINLFLQDVMAIGKKLTLKAGFRYTYAFNLRKAYPEPRLSLSVKGGEYWKFNLAWGLYNQFIAKSAITDNLGNYRYLWVIANNEDIPVLQASHFVIGTSFHRNRFTLSLESYFKHTTGLTRFINFPDKEVREISQGEGYSIGLDLLLKKDFKKHSAWISYSLSKTIERFDYFLYFDYDGYIRAPQDQVHELKLALLLNFDPFFLSTNYVYGSGFPPGYVTPETKSPAELTYSRLDISFIYKFLDRKWKGEAGLSILNLLNTQNIKYSNFERIPAYLTNTINIYAEAIPFTPTLYVKIAL